MNTFVNAVKNTPVMTTTTNGMAAYEGTLDKNLDLYYAIGASRGKDISNLFLGAYLDNEELAIRTLLWARDARGGAGERDLFRKALLQLEKLNQKVLLETKILDLVPELGRWDDLLIFQTPEVIEKALGLIKAALAANNGLCAKWMPRKGIQANQLRAAFGWTPKYYRKRLVELTKVVETQMCSGNWAEINFEHVPSVAFSRYSKAFHKHVPEKFVKFIKDVKEGVKTVHAGAIFPHDIVKNVRSGNADAADIQWAALPNFIGDKKVLPLVDVSGSMCSGIPNSNLTAMDVSVALGLYCSDKNTGVFKDMFLTFEAQPQFVTVKGTLSQKVKQMEGSPWGGNTNLEAALKLILDVAVKNNVAVEDMPQYLLILSDMQFDQALSHYGRGINDTAIQMINKQYVDAGYPAPVVVFWNIMHAGNMPATKNQRSVALVSGFSPAVVKTVLSADFDSLTPMNIFLSTVTSDRYDYKK